LAGYYFLGADLTGADPEPDPDPTLELPALIN
jgi:hypothetical protein